MDAMKELFDRELVRRLDGLEARIESLETAVFVSEPSAEHTLPAPAPAGVVMAAEPGPADLLLAELSGSARARVAPGRGARSRGSRGRWSPFDRMSTGRTPPTEPPSSPRSHGRPRRLRPPTRGHSTIDPSANRSSSWPGASPKRPGLPVRTTGFRPGDHPSRSRPTRPVWTCATWRSVSRGVRSRSWAEPHSSWAWSSSSASPSAAAGSATNCRSPSASPGAPRPCSWVGFSCRAPTRSWATCSRPSAWPSSRSRSSPPRRSTSSSTRRSAWPACSRLPSRRQPSPSGHAARSWPPTASWPCSRRRRSWAPAPTS